MKLGRTLALLIALVGTSSSAHASGDGVPDRGFLLRIGLGASNVSPTLAYPALTAGYRLIDRIEIHLSIAFLAAGATGTTGGGGGSSVGGYFTLTPGVTIDLIRFLNNKVVFIGDAGLPLGVAFGGAGGTGGGGSGAAFVIGFNVGLGIRYAVVPIFTVGFEGGVLGLFTVGANTGGAAGAGTAVGFYGALAGTLYFGK